jgi:excisionase family DNA binding protein
LDDERLISLKEAATRCELSYSQLRRLVRLGRIEARRVGWEWLTTPDAVAAYLANPHWRSRDPLKYKRAGHSDET